MTNPQMDQPSSAEPTRPERPDESPPPYRRRWTWLRWLGLALLVTALAGIVWSVLGVREAVSVARMFMGGSDSIENDYKYERLGLEPYGGSSSCAIGDSPPKFDFEPWFWVFVGGAWGAIVVGLLLARMRWLWLALLPAGVLTAAIFLLPRTLTQPERGSRLEVVVSYTPEFGPALTPADVEKLKQAMVPEVVLAALPPGGPAAQLDVKSRNLVRKVQVELIPLAGPTTRSALGAIDDRTKSIVPGGLGATIDKQAGGQISKFEGESSKLSADTPRFGARAQIDIALPYRDSRCQELAAFYSCSFHKAVTDHFKEPPVSLKPRSAQPAVEQWLQPWLASIEQSRAAPQDAKALEEIRLVVKACLSSAKDHQNRLPGTISDLAPYLPASFDLKPYRLERNYQTLAEIKDPAKVLLISRNLVYRADTGKRAWGYADGHGEVQ